MRRVVSAAAILTFTATATLPALAADLPFKAPAVTPAAPVPFTWTGCHVGVHAGADISYDKIRSSGDFSSAGFIGGGQIGCDYQFASGWVVGAEGRAAWSSLSSDTSGRVSFPTVAVPTHFTVSNDFLASATARVGYSFADRWLVFVRGGAAWTREKADHAYTIPTGAFIPGFLPFFPPSPASPLAVDPSGSMNQFGWTAGAGVEWAFDPHWSTSFEYNYYDFGENAFTLHDAASNTGVMGALKDRIHTVTAGLNYHF